MLISGEPTRTKHRLPGMDADLYVPTGTSNVGGLVVTLGVHPLDKLDPVVVRFVSALSRAGLAVLVVQSDALMADRIETAEPRRLASAWEWLSAQPRVDPGRIGFFGFSAGASLAANAATEPEIAERVRIVAWIGGFADARLLAIEMQSQHAWTDRGWVPWEPHDVSRQVFLKALTDAVANPDDRVILESIAQAGEVAEEPQSLAGRAVANVLRATNPQAASTAVAALPDDLSGYLRRLSPIESADRLRARTLFMVDRSDPLVPSTHTRSMFAAVRPEIVDRYVVLDLLEHVQPTRTISAIEMIRDVRAITAALASILLQLDPSW
ncbi:MAG: hypothetical protein EPO26_11530 [Chloroflexota bacterium]|nr:MAG: hypothetical protein EPO26_11530 [Chloroflexota bacterium]